MCWSNQGWVCIYDCCNAAFFNFLENHIIFQEYLWCMLYSKNQYFKYWLNAKPQTIEGKHLAGSQGLGTGLGNIAHPISYIPIWVESIISFDLLWKYREQNTLYISLFRHMILFLIFVTYKKKYLAILAIWHWCQWNHNNIVNLTDDFLVNRYSIKNFI